MKRINVIVLICLGALNLAAQEKPKGKEPMPEYYKKEEVIYDGKRYRIHNSYLSVGAGFLNASIRKSIQKTVGVDFQFPIKKLHFQAGVMMSGESFGSNNNIQGHVGYGLRKEKRYTNLAAYAGPTFYTGVEGEATSAPKFYQGVGIYVSGQAVTKLAYDIGIGAEIFAEANAKQIIAGLKVITFFSGAYRGLKKNYNPNVRAER